MTETTLKNQVRLCAEAIGTERAICEKQVRYALQDKKHDPEALSENLGYLAVIQYAEKDFRTLQDIDFSGESVSLSVLFNRAGEKGVSGAAQLPNDPSFFSVLHQLATMNLKNEVGLPREQKTILAFALGAFASAEKEAVFKGASKALDFIKTLDIEMLEASDLLSGSFQPEPGTPESPAP